MRRCEPHFDAQREERNARLKSATVFAFHVIFPSLGGVERCTFWKKRSLLMATPAHDGEDGAHE